MLTTSERLNGILADYVNIHQFGHGFRYFQVVFEWRWEDEQWFAYVLQNGRQFGPASLRVLSQRLRIAANFLVALNDLYADTASDPFWTSYKKESNE